MAHLPKIYPNQFTTLTVPQQSLPMILHVILRGIRAENGACRSSRSVVAHAHLSQHLYLDVSDAL